MMPWLESEQQQEGHHQTEETHSLGQGKTQDGIGEELLLQRGVAGVADNQTSEHTPNSSPWNTERTFMSTFFFSEMEQQATFSQKFEQ